MFVRKNKNSPPPKTRKRAEKSGIQQSMGRNTHLRQAQTHIVRVTHTTNEPSLATTGGGDASCFQFEIVEIVVDTLALAGHKLTTGGNVQALLAKLLETFAQTFVERILGRIPLP